MRLPGRLRVRGSDGDTAFPEGIASLAVIADGTTSLSTSTGGGTVGAGTHETVAAASRDLLTFEGGRTAEADEQDLGEGRHPLSGVFHAAHDMITELREIEQGPAAGA